MAKIATLSIVVFCTLLLAGCSHTLTDANGNQVTYSPNGATTYKGANGDTATVSQNGSQMSVQAQTKEGTSSYTANQNGSVNYTDTKGNNMQMGSSVTEDDLGVPFYPGSTDMPAGDLKLNGNEGNEVHSTRTTSDDPDKVISFYTDKLGKADSNYSTAQMSMATWKDKDGKNIVLSVTKTDKGQTISLVVATKKK